MPMPYPRTVSEVLDPNMRFKRGVLPVMKEFRRRRPWRGTVEQRYVLFQWLLEELSSIYGIPTPRLRFANVRLGSQPGASGESFYTPMFHEIVLVNKPSVVTLLHEFAHALGHGEYGAARWSLNLFKRVFPRRFERLARRGHMLISERSRDVSG